MPQSHVIANPRLLRTAVWSLLLGALTACGVNGPPLSVGKNPAELGPVGADQDPSAPRSRGDHWETFALNPYSGRLAGEDPLGEALRFEIVTPPANGQLAYFDAATGVFTYVPADSFQNRESFTYRVRAGERVSPVAIVVIDVLPRFRPWMSPEDPADVNRDRNITLFDVLVVINRIRDGGTLLGEYQTGSGFVDVNGDGYVTEADAESIVARLEGSGTNSLQLPDNPCAPGGVLAEGQCWYLGNPGESCHDACAARLGCGEAATRDLLGSGSEDIRVCDAVLRRMGRWRGYTPGMQNFASVSNPPGVGCHMDLLYQARWEGGVPTTCEAKAIGTRRLCACNG